MAIRRKSGVSYEPSGNVVVILDAEGTLLTTLNPVGSLIWRAFDGQRGVRALARDLIQEFDGIDEERLAADIELFVEELSEAGLVEVS